jgi:hypothetical protein
MVSAKAYIGLPEWGCNEMAPHTINTLVFGYSHIGDTKSLTMVVANVKFLTNPIEFRMNSVHVTLDSVEPLYLFCVGGPKPRIQARSGEHPARRHAWLQRPPPPLSRLGRTEGLVRRQGYRV